MRSPSKQNQGVAARIAAAQLLSYVLGNKDTVDEALDKIYVKHRLNDEDRRLVHAICGYVFRNLPAIDANLRQVMNRKRDPDPVMLHHLLRVGAAQLLYMDVAPHAAVDTCVSAAGSLGVSRQKGLVNAVLRSVHRQKDSLLAAPWAALNLLPAWLSGRLIRAYGESAAEQIAGAMRQEAPLDIGIKDAKASHEWGRLLSGEVLLEGAVRVRQRAGHITSWHGFADGSWWVQDLAASLPISMLGDIAGKSLIDVCAAPGGKTQQAASRGARVTALDIAPTRMQRVTENLVRLNLAQQVQTSVTDARQWRPQLHPDIVVLDAPCSATGTLRRHPELPWIHKENDVEQLKVMQHELMWHCAGWLDSGGILLYCTCSLDPEEGEGQVDSFLNHFKDFKEITSVPAVVHPYVHRGINNTGWRTNPALLADKGGLDGFFIALLQKQ